MTAERVARTDAGEGADARALLLAVDIGSTLVKAALVRADNGNVVAAGKTPLPLARTGDRAELDADALWEAFAHAVRAVLRQPAEPPDVRAIGVTAQMAGVALLDERRRPVRGIIPGVDVRGAAYVPALVSRLDAPLVYARTGCPLTGIYPSVKLLGLQAEEPEALQRAHYVGGVKEVVLQRLTGRWVTDPATASCTQLYDQLAGGWWPEAIEAVGIGRKRLPELRRPDEAAGPLLAEAAHALRLAAGTPVFVGTGDGPAANLSTGAITAGELCISFGTTAVTRYFTEGIPSAEGLPSGDEEAWKQYFRQHFGGRLFLHGYRLEGAGPALEPFLPAAGDEAAVRADDEAALLFDPYAADPARRFVGDIATASRGDKLRAVQDGIVLALREAMEPALAARPFRDVRPIGGGAANRRWMQDVADLFGLPVVLTQGGDSTLGAAMIVLKGTGAAATWQQAAERIVRVAAVLEPDGAAGERWRRRMEWFKELRERRGWP